MAIDGDRWRNTPMRGTDSQPQSAEAPGKHPLRKLGTHPGKIFEIAPSQGVEPVTLRDDVR